MNSWDEKPILTKYTKRLLGIADTSEKEDSVLSELRKEILNKSDPEPTKRNLPNNKKKQASEYPYARRSSKSRENTSDSIDIVKATNTISLRSDGIQINNYKKLSLDTPSQAPKSGTKKLSLPIERRAMKLDRLKRLYEDEMVSRKPVRFNSFDLFEDEIGSKKGSKGSPIIMEFDLAESMGSGYFEKKSSNAPNVDSMPPILPREGTYQSFARPFIE